MLRLADGHLKLQHACRFFEDYKRNEHKDVKVDEILGHEKALEIIRAAMVGCHSSRKTQPVLLHCAVCFCSMLSVPAQGLRTLGQLCAAWDLRQSMGAM